MKRAVVAMLTLLTASSCTSAEDERRIAAEREQQRHTVDHRKCVSYGFVFGTDAYAQCRQRFDLLYEEERAAKGRMLMQRTLWR